MGGWGRQEEKGGEGRETSITVFLLFPRRKGPFFLLFFPALRLPLLLPPPLHSEQKNVFRKTNNVTSDLHPENGTKRKKKSFFLPPPPSRPSDTLTKSSFHKRILSHSHHLSKFARYLRFLFFRYLINHKSRGSNLCFFYQFTRGSITFSLRHDDTDKAKTKFKKGASLFVFFPRASG